MRSVLHVFAALLVALSISALVVVPRTAKCTTNRECLARGLPPLRPRGKSFKPRVDTTSITGYIRYPQMSNKYSTSVSTTSYDQDSSTLTGSLMVTITYPTGATTLQSGLQIQIANPMTNGLYLALGTDSTTNAGTTITSSSSSFLRLIGANSTTPPDSGAVNTIANTLGSGHYLETGVWNYDPTTKAITAAWNNGQQSVPLTFMFQNSYGPYLTGSPTALNAALPPMTSTSAQLYSPN